ncbi:MAG: hypothetical protein GY788_29705 [bacterium]|nr:hypothetical protein [bacterium]
MIGVERKVDEPFGPTVEDWLVDASRGKRERLAFLCNKLTLSVEAARGLRYQLLHRTVTAMLEAERFGASTALMLVHSFSETASGYDDYCSFATALVIVPDRNAIAQLTDCSPAIHLAWIA